MFEEIDVFYRGLLLGLMIAAPVGPVGLLCIRRSIQKGVLIGFATGLGAACADTIFGAMSALGFAAITDFIHHYDMAIRILGGLFLLYGAWHIWRDHPKPPQSDPIAIVKKFIGLTTRENKHTVAAIFKAFVSAFAITLTNPVTIFAVLAVVAAFGHVSGHLDAATIVGGIFVGSVAWWFLLSSGIALLRGHFTESRIMIVNRITASVLASLSAVAVATGIMELAHRLHGA